MKKYFLNNSFLRLHPKKTPITISKTFSFSLDNPDMPSKNEPSSPPPCSLPEIPKSHSENYKKDSSLRRQPMKDYRVFIPQSKISASRMMHI